MQYSESKETDGTARSVDLGQMKDLQVILSEHAKVCTDYNEDKILIVNDDAFVPANTMNSATG